MLFSKYSFLKYLFYFALPLFFNRCVSIEITSKEEKKSSQINFREPEKNFTSFKMEHADHAWENKKDGSTISFYSECSIQDENENLEKIQASILQDLNNRKILITKKIVFNNRPALDSIFQGTLEGVTTKIRMVIFIKNNCLYNLTFIALPIYFNLHEPTFQKFIEGFKVP